MNQFKMYILKSLLFILCLFSLKNLFIFIFASAYPLRVRSAFFCQSIYRKTSISPPWRSIFQPFPYSGVLLEVTFN